MILLMLTTRSRDDLDHMWIEDVSLFSYDLNFHWTSLMLRIFHSLFMTSVSVDLVELENIQYSMINS